ncbi:MAG: undecaprenyl-diphosphate phosphatase [Clostridia bacterium]|nr:undecaprenyl-diphosphate phosphatase [Clostridia bacterium]
MELLIALFFGVVQGATEFLPISSGGHLVMIQSFNQTVFGEALFSPTLTFDILLRLGTLLAMLFVFFHDIRLLWQELMGCIGELWHRNFRIKTDRPYRKLLFMLVITTMFLIPAVFLTELTNTYLSGLTVIACMMMITGIVNFLPDRIDLVKKTVMRGTESSLESAFNVETEIAVAEESQETKPENHYRQAILVGVFQLCSIIPGLSRCGITMLGGLIAGFRKDFTVKYAFLSAIPVLVAKILLQTVTVLQDGIQMNWIPYLFGMLAALVSGVVSIAVMRKAMRKGYCKRFGIYFLIV